MGAFSLRFLFVTALFFAVSCKTAHNKSEIESAMIRYNYFIQKVDADSIASMFTPDGDLGKMAHGQESIKNFLGGFKNFQVLSQKSETESIQLKKDSATQIGHYKQVAVVGKDTFRVKGEFTAQWLWLKQIGWRIKSMETKPN